MSKAVKAVSRAVKGTVKAVGNAVSSGAKTVAKAVESTGKAINNYVIEPIKKDPITAIATAAGFTLGGPMGAAAANAASNKAQGRSWGDSLKSGAITWAVGEVTQGVADKLGSPTAGSGAPVQEGFNGPTTSQVANAADSFAANATKPTSSILTEVAKESLASPTAAASPLSSVSATPSYSNLISDTLSQDILQSPVMKYGTDYQPMYDSYGDELWNAPKVDQSVVDVTAAANGPDMGGKFTSASDIPTMNRTDLTTGITQDVQPRGVDLVTGKPPVYDYSYNAADPSALSMTQSGLETAGSWLWDGAKWVWNHPLESVIGYSLLDKYLNNPKQPDSSVQNAGDQNKANQSFDTNLSDINPSQFDLYTMRRNRQKYAGDINTYGEAGGEHQFFTPATYVPVSDTSTYTPDQYAEGGSVGALSAMQPSYYRYGALPQAFANGGYARGGNPPDGRADNIPAMLSHGEYVVDAETVGLLGNGSSDAGAVKLDQMRKNIRQQKGKALSKGQFSPNAMSPLAYIKQRG